MKTVYFSVSLVTGAFMVFIALCVAPLNVPFVFLFLFLVMLKIGLVWMVITILKKGVPSGHTFDDTYYDDAAY